MSDELKFEGLLERLGAFIRDCYKAIDDRLNALGITEEDARSERCTMNIYVTNTDEYRSIYYDHLPLFYTHIWFDKDAGSFSFQLKNGERPEISNTVTKSEEVTDCETKTS